jgi:membrane-associated phospholipid phosphatase
LSDGVSSGRALFGTDKNDDRGNRQTAGSGGTATTSPRPSLLKPFTTVFSDFRHLPTRQNMAWLAAGLGAAAAVHPMDTTVSREFSATRTRSFKAGAILGGTPVELGGAFAAYIIGRATDRPRVMSVGADLIRAQVLAELFTTGVKQSVRRPRPEGAGFSFPSGHTAVSFASATVLQEHFGWKVGFPAYAVASYVAASRVQMKRHYLSDIALGATVGIVSGRTVTLGGRHKVMLAPMASTDGAGLSFIWLGGR